MDLGSMLAGAFLLAILAGSWTADDVARYVDQHRAPAPFVPGELCAWPAVSTLAAEAGCSGRWTRQAVEFMEEAGLLLVEVRNTGRGRTSSAYKLAAKALTVYQQASEARQARDAGRAEAWKPRPALPPGARPHRSPATAGWARKAAPAAGAQWNSSAAGPSPEALPVEPSGTPVPPTYPRPANGKTELASYEEQATATATESSERGTEAASKAAGVKAGQALATEAERREGCAIASPPSLVAAKAEQLVGTRTVNGAPPSSAPPPVEPVAQLREWAPRLCARLSAQASGSGSLALREALAGADLATVERVARACERSGLSIAQWAHRLGVMGVTRKGPRSGLVWLVEQAPALAAALQKAKARNVGRAVVDTGLSPEELLRDIARLAAEDAAYEQARRGALTPEAREAEDRAKAVEAAELEQLRAANPPREGEGLMSYELRVALMRPDELQAEQARPATARPAPDREQRPELRMGLAELLGAALRGPA